jgi:hypothetical protein
VLDFRSTTVPRRSGEVDPDRTTQDRNSTRRRSSRHLRRFDCTDSHRLVEISRRVGYTGKCMYPLASKFAAIDLSYSKTIRFKFACQNRFHRAASRIRVQEFNMNCWPPSAFAENRAIISRHRDKRLLRHRFFVTVDFFAEKLRPLFLRPLPFS